MVVLLSLIGLLALGLELFARAVVERTSNVQRMVNSEFRDAIAIRRQPSPAPKQMLVIGNSLVGHGLNFRLLEAGLGANWQLHRFWIYNTSYDDWYFGLRRLFADGSRPDVVAVQFAAMHWYASEIRGDYSAQYMFQARDVPAISGELNLDRTTASDLVFARFSKFYALRSEIRKVLLAQLIPDLPRMYGLFKPTATKHVEDREIVDLLTARIEKLQALVESNGATLVLLVPPIPRPGEEHHQALKDAAAAAGVQVFIPLSYADLPPTDFADDVHMTPAGADLYTSKLVGELRPALLKATIRNRR